MISVLGAKVSRCGKFGDDGKPGAASTEGCAPTLHVLIWIDCRDVHSTFSIKQYHIFSIILVECVHWLHHSRCLEQVGRNKLKVTVLEMAERLEREFAK